MERRLRVSHKGTFGAAEGGLQRGRAEVPTAAPRRDLRKMRPGSWGHMRGWMKGFEWAQRGGYSFVAAA